MRVSALKRHFIIGLVSVAALGGPSGIAPPVAYALPPGPTEPGDPGDPPGPPGPWQLEPQTKTDLGEVLTAALRTKFPDLCSVTAAQVIGSELVVHYVTPPFPGGLCTPPSTNAQS